MTAIDYFYRNSPKEWKLLDALEAYDTADNSHVGFHQLLDMIKKDLLIVRKSQPRFSKATHVKINEINVSKSKLKGGRSLEILITHLILFRDY